MWWQLDVGANLAISLAYFAICYAILAPLVREGQLRANRLGAATAAIFFSCGVGHGMHGLHPLLLSMGDHSALAVASRVIPAHEAVWDIVTAAVGLYYWTLRRTYGSLMRGAALFADLEQERLAAELGSRQVLAEHRDRLAGVLDAVTGQAIVGTDLSGRVTVFNVGAQRLLGYPAEHMLGRRPAELFDPSEVLAYATEVDIEPVWAAVTQAMVDRPSEARHWTCATADGRRLTVTLNVTAMHDAAGEVSGYITVGTDVTDRLRAEAVLADERRRLRDAQAIGHVGSWERDLATDAMLWSDGLYDIYGVERGTPHGDYGTGLSRMMPDERNALVAAMDGCAVSGAPFQLRYGRTRLNDGEERWFELRGAPIYEHGRVVRIGGAVADVTEQIEAARTLEEARDMALEASRQKSAFLATMSHEIRTPMNAVIGMTGLLLDTPLDDDQREFVDIVRTSGDSLLLIINDILDFSKIEAGGLVLEDRPFDLRSCVEESLDLVAATSNAKGLEVVGHIDARCPSRVTGDVTRLRQVLVNLLGNAVKFTARGEVVLTVEPDAEPDAGPDAGPDAEPHAGPAGRAGAGLRIAVTDTGIGIPADRLGRLFDSFSQVDASTTRVYGGTGLGLAISHRLVEAMGGVLTVESVSGTGSTFHFSVPFGPAPPAPDRDISRPPPALAGRAVLLVDDNRTNLGILRLQLESWGMVVTEASSGDAAMTALGAGERFDIAVLDMKMSGLSGADLAMRLRSLPAARRLPLVLLSSRGDRPAVQPPDLFSAVLTKPVRSARLQQLLRDALHPEVVVPSPAPPSEAGPPKVALRVLLAEDNAVNQRLGRLMLEKLGHRVDVVGNGREATEAVRLVPYDAVLMDVEMPEMDGLEATRVIRRDRIASGQPQIVAMTASALAEDRKACNDAGMDDYLAKPVRLEDLDAALVKAAAAHHHS